MFDIRAQNHGLQGSNLETWYTDQKLLSLWVDAVAREALDDSATLIVCDVGDRAEWEADG